MTVYEIDLSRHVMTIGARLPSRDTSFSFHAAINIEWHVVDPSAVVRHKVSDIAKTLTPELLRRMRQIARKFDISQAAEAEDSINLEFDNLEVDVTELGRLEHATTKESVLRRSLGAAYGLWTRTIVSITLDETAAEHYTKVRQIRWEIDQEKVAQELRHLQERNQLEITHGRMNEYRAIIESGDTELFVLQLAGNPQDIGPVLRVFREEKEAKRKNFIDFISRMIESGVVERWQVSDQARSALEWLKEEIAGIIPEHQHRLGPESAHRQHRTGRATLDADTATSTRPRQGNEQSDQ